MGSEPARLQERLEAALGPAWGIEREVRLAARLQHPHVVHTPTEVGTALRTPESMVPDQVTGDPAMDHCADLYALGVMAYELLAASHPFAGRAPHAAVAIRERRRGLTWPRRDCDVDAGLRRQLVVRRPNHPCMCRHDLRARPQLRSCALLQPCPLASTLLATHVKRTPAPRDSGSSTREVVFPPPTGGRFK
jgi:serine/threonine protein kinase